MLAKVKRKLDEERKKRKSKIWSAMVIRHRVGRNPFHARLADSLVNPEGFGLSAWFQFLLSKCIDQEKIGTSFPRIPHPRANEEAQLLLSRQI